MKTKRTFHQLGTRVYDVDTKWVGRKQYTIHVEGVGDTWYLAFDGKRPTFSQTEYKVLDLLEKKGVLK